MSRADRLDLPEWRCYIPPMFTPGTPLAVQRSLGDPANLNGYYVRAESAAEACALLTEKHGLSFHCPGGEPWKPPLYPLPEAEVTSE